MFFPKIFHIPTEPDKQREKKRKLEGLPEPTIGPVSEAVPGTGKKRKHERVDDTTNRQSNVSFKVS